MKKVSKFIFYYFLILIISWLPTAVSAQGPGDPGCDPFGYRCDENGENCVICPIDDGLIWLIAAGIGYGIYRSRKPKVGPEHAT